MTRPVSAVAALLLLGGLLGGLCLAGTGPLGTAAAQENPLVGSWITVDPGTGIREKLTVTSDSLAFGGIEPAIPYRLVREDGALHVYLAGAEDPATFTFIDETNAHLSVPGGPTISLKRDAAVPRGAAAVPRRSIIDEAAEALLPQGTSQGADRTANRGAGRPFDPRNPTLEGLLAKGWRLDQVTDSSSGITLLMSNGGHHALCVLLPRPPAGGGGAPADCRRLN